MSGGHGDHFSIMREVEDMQALMAKTGACNLFGLSAGGLVVLRTAFATPAIRKVALYEPPLDIQGSAPMGWVPQYEREMAQGKMAAATVTAMKGIGTERLFRRLPRFLLVPLMALIMNCRAIQSGEVTIRSLIPTMHFDAHIIKELRNTVQDYCSLSTPILLLGGRKEPILS